MTYVIYTASPYESWVSVWAVTQDLFKAIGFARDARRQGHAAQLVAEPA